MLKLATWASVLALAGSAFAQPAFQRRLQADPRMEHAVAVDLIRSRAVLFGGNGDNGQRNDTWEWDGVAWTQAAPPAQPSPREGHAMAFDIATGLVILFGGTTGTAQDDTWSYDGFTWTQLSPSNSPPPRHQHVMAYDHLTQRIILHGGFNSNGTLDDTWAWNGSDWTLIGTNGPQINRAGAAFDFVNLKVLMFGGRAPNGAVQNTTWLLDSNTGVWTAQSPATIPAATYSFGISDDLARSRVVMVPRFSTQTWEWNGTNWTSKSPANRPSNREAQVMFYDPNRGEVLYTGGSTGQRQADTWSWNGNDWTRLQPAPDSLQAGALAYYPATGETLLHGGTFGSSRSDRTWSWDGNIWTDVTAANPFNRINHSMTYAPNAGGMLMFGGRDGPFQSTTYLWSGGNWLLQTPATTPAAREHHAACADANGDLLIFGGIGNTPPLGDTWRYTGGNWTQVVTPGPSTRYGAAMVHDGTGVVLFGGRNGGTRLNDTWRFNGSTWTQLNPSTQPSPRAGHRMIFDAARNRVFLFGGWTGSTYFDDLWVWDGNDWEDCGSLGIGGRHESHFAADTTRQSLLIFGGRGTPTYNDMHTSVALSAATTNSIGSGCVPSGTPPSLVGISDATCLGGSGPTMGTQWTLRAQGLPLTASPSVTFLFAGAAAPSPVSLCPAQQPACQIFIDLGIVIPISTVRIVSNAEVKLAVPVAPWLVGQTFFVQALGAMPTSSCLGGLYTTDALSATLGSL